MFFYKSKCNYCLKILLVIIHFLMFSLCLFQLIAGNQFSTVILCFLVIGYGCSGFSLLSIGGQIFKWIAFIMNAIYLVFCLVGLIYFAIISPLSGGVFDTVALVGSIVFGVVGGVTIKLLKMPFLQ